MANSNRLSYRVVLLGNSGVGKTSLVRMFTEEAFNPTYPTTIGVCTFSKRITYKGRSARFEVSDTGGQERFASLAPIYCRNADAVLLCFDLTNIKSFEDMDKWRLTNGIPDKAILVAIGCKSDLTDQREVTESMISEKCRRYKDIKFFETSSKKNENITEIFVHLLTILMSNTSTDKPDANIITLKPSSSGDDNNSRRSLFSSCCGWFS